MSAGVRKELTERDVEETTGGHGDSEPRHILPEDCVEYMVFVNDSGLDGRKTISSLAAARQAALQLADKLAGDYIWQRDAFNLMTQSENGMFYLRGLTDYGDSVEDEWLIVYILRELSKQLPNLWIRVFDSDGEFLLVEAANVLPKWINPEIDANRVWINQGQIALVPLEMQSGVGDRTISLSAAVARIRTDPGSLVRSSFIEAEAFYRLDKYPGHIQASMHHATATIPRKLAYILHQRPKSIAPAVEAFYLRDPVAMKPLLSPAADHLVFPPADLVTVSVRFTRVLYAQLKSQRFAAPPVWQKISSTTGDSGKGESDGAAESQSRVDLGMKVTCGFELFAAKANKSNNRVAREVAFLLEDLEEDGEEAALPTDEDIRNWADVDREDSDSWMDINYDDFERELEGKSGEPSAARSGFGDANTQADLRKIVSRFEAFLNDDGAGIEGAELDDMDIDDDDETDSQDSEGEDKEVSFDEEEFTRMMREMMGFPARRDGQRSEAAAVGTAQDLEPIHGHNKDDEDDDQDDDDDEAIRKHSEMLEAELNEHGALSLNSDPKQPAAIRGKSSDVKVASGAKEGENDEGGEGESESEDEQVDIDYNLAKNLLESFKSQAGMAGPAGNILGMLGMALPRDEAEEDDDG